MWVKSMKDAVITGLIVAFFFAFSVDGGIELVSSTAFSPIGLFTIVALAFFEIAGLRW